MSAAVLPLPRGFDVPVEFRSIVIGTRTGCPVSHVDLGLRGRTTGNARRYRDRLWFEIDTGGDRQWWAANNILRDAGLRRPVPLLTGDAA